jgi:O-antigen/teichoic acid export membrane protein
MLVALFKRAGRVAVGTAIGQGMVLLITPYLSRHYSPEAFGLLALLMTVSGVSMAVACLRYDMALPSSPDSEVKGLLATSMIVASAVALIAFVSCALLSGSSVSKHLGGLAEKPALVGGCVLFVALYQATSAWFLRRGAFTSFAYMRLSQGAGFSILATVPGIGLLWAYVLSFGGGLIGLRSALSREATASLPWHVTARRNKDFPMLSLPGALLDVCGCSVCIWVIASCYGPAMAGNYSQVQRLIGAPLMLVSLSVGQILLRQTAELSADRAALRRFLIRVFGVMAGLAIAGLLVLWICGEPLFARLLGSQWKVDREFILLVAVALCVRACVSPLSSVLLTLRCFGSALIWQSLYFCSALLFMPLVAAWVGFEHYLQFYAAHECVFYGFYLVLIYRAVRLEKKELKSQCAES